MKTTYYNEAVCYNPRIAESYKNVSIRINEFRKKHSNAGMIDIVDISSFAVDKVVYVNITFEVVEY